jgi:hypothetical protein
MHKARSPESGLEALNVGLALDRVRLRAHYPRPPRIGTTSALLPPAIAAAIVDPIEFAALRKG